MATMRSYWIKIGPELSESNSVKGRTVCTEKTIHDRGQIDMLRLTGIVGNRKRPECVYVWPFPQEKDTSASVLLTSKRMNSCYWTLCGGAGYRLQFPWNTQLLPLDDVFHNIKKNKK